MRVGGQPHAPAALPPGKTWYPLYKRLGGPHGQSDCKMCHVTLISGRLCCGRAIQGPTLPKIISSCLKFMVWIFSEIPISSNPLWFKKLCEKSVDSYLCKSQLKMGSANI